MSEDFGNHLLGKLCRHGHESSPGSQQSWRRQRSEGKTGPCVACEKIAVQRYRQSPKGKKGIRNREESPEYRAKRQRYDQKSAAKARRGAHQQTDEHKAYMKAYNQTYTEPESSRQHRLDRMKAPAVKAQQRGYRMLPETKQQTNARLRSRYVTDEAFAFRRRLRSRLSHAFAQLSTVGKAKTSDEYGINYTAILQHLGPCPGTREQWHIDHIRPLASFDWDDPNTPRLAFAPDNHQWLRAEENLSKGTSRSLEL